MAFNAFVASFVCPIHNADQLTPVAIGIFEERMAAQAKSSVFVERKKFVRIGMVDRRSMAVFTLDGLMG